MRATALLRAALIWAARLAGDLEAARASQERLQARLREAQQQTADAALEASHCERKAALLSAECDGLKRIVAAHKSDATCAQAASGRAGHPDAHGDVHHATTRVVHMVHNPESLARREAVEARFAMLQAENAALRNQLARLEAVSAPATAPAAHSQSPESQTATPAADGAMSLALAQAEIAVLNRKVSPVCSVGSGRLSSCFAFCLLLLMGPLVKPLLTLVTKPPHALSAGPWNVALQRRCEGWKSASSG